MPVLVATDAVAAPLNLPLGLSGAVTSVLDADAESLGTLLDSLGRSFAVTLRAARCSGMDGQRPTARFPTIVEAACMLYARHGVADIAAARADTHNLTITTQALLAMISLARADGERVVLFVTGVPGAGKTLCGLECGIWRSRRGARDSS